MAKKTIIKSSALNKTIDAATSSIESASNDAGKAVAKVTSDAKKLTAEVKRHTKKRSILTKRKKAATTKQKSNPNAANRKALATVVKELKSTISAQEKARTNKTKTTEELNGLRDASKRLNAYSKAIAAADRVLNKPKKKARRKSK